MRLPHYVLACVAATVALPVQAQDVGSGTVQLGSSNAVQLGRLSRNGVQQDWIGTETFPGVINPATAYAYTTIGLPFRPNAFQPIYYDITFDDEATDLFASAYLDNYDPSNLSMNWLGDAGSSGNYFPNDPRYFDVVVPKGHSLLLVINSATGLSTTSTANYFVNAYSDTEYSTNFLGAGVPEPGTWALMIIGLGAVGGSMRKRAKVQTKAWVA